MDQHSTSYLLGILVGVCKHNQDVLRHSLETCCGPRQSCVWKQKNWGQSDLSVILILLQNSKESKNSKFEFELLGCYEHTFAKAERQNIKYE